MIQMYHDFYSPNALFDLLYFPLFSQVFFAPSKNCEHKEHISILRKRFNLCKIQTLRSFKLFFGYTFRETCSCVYEVELIHIQDFHMHLYLLSYMKMLLSKSIQVLLYNNTADQYTPRSCIHIYSTTL